MIVSLRNFRGVKDLDIELSDITIFIGSNDSGKSSTLEAIYLILSSFSYFRNRFRAYFPPNVSPIQKEHTCGIIDFLWGEVS
ncbi:MAG: AAA family ATPase [Candidatus Njordarchaeia archaeon]